MKSYLVMTATLLLATPLVASDRRFIAADAPVAKMKPGVIIKNDSQRITAFRFAGNIREALVSLRATRTIATRPFGGSVFQSGAALNEAVPADLSAHIADAARTHGVDPRLVAAVVRRESAFKVHAVSPVGASGLMQLMPATARFLGVKNVFDARENIFGGTRYLRTLLDTFNGDLDLTLAAYNAGPGAVRKYNGVPPYRETRAYVAAVRSSYERSLRPKA